MADTVEFSQSQNMAGVLNELLESDKNSGANASNIVAGADGDKKSTIDESVENKENSLNTTHEEPTSEINKTLLMRHDRFQKMLAKRAMRVQRIASAVNKKIEKSVKEGSGASQIIDKATVSDDEDASDDEKIVTATQKLRKTVVFDDDDDDNDNEISASTQKMTQSIDLGTESLSSQPMSVAQPLVGLSETIDESQKDKIQELAQQRKEARLLQDLAEEEKLLKELESRVANENLKDSSNRKDLLDIALKTQQLSMKYNCEPVLYTKIEISKNDLLRDFEFENGEFQASKESIPQSSTYANSQADEAIDIENESSHTEMSDVEDVFGASKKDETLNETKSTKLSSPLVKYASKLKRDLQFDGKDSLVFNSDSDSDIEVETPEMKAKKFEIKLKFAKKQKQNGKLVKKETSNNMNKKQIFSMFMTKHRDNLKKKKELENETMTGNLFESNDVEGDITVEKLLQDEMIYQMNKREKSRQSKQETVADQDDASDSDYTAYSGSEEEGDEDEESDKENEDNNDLALGVEDPSGSKVDHDSGADVDDIEENEVKITYNANLIAKEADEVDEADDKTDDENSEVVPSKVRSRNGPLLDSEDEDDGNISGVGTEPSAFSGVGTEPYISGTNGIGAGSDADISFSGPGLTQKMKSMIGKDLSQLASLPASVPPSTVENSGNLMQRLRDNDNLFDSVNDESINQDESIMSFSEKPAQANDGNFLVPGFDFDKEEAEREESALKISKMINTQATQATIMDSFRLEESQEAEQTALKAKRRLFRKKDLETQYDAQNLDEGTVAEDEEGLEEELDEEEKEQLRIEENKKLFVMQKQMEMKKLLKEKEMEKKGLKDMIDEEADESEDEWQGFGGKDKDDLDEANSDDEKLIDNVTKISEKDNQMLMERVKNDEIADDQEMVDKIMNDLKNGTLKNRGRNGENFDLFGDFDDEYDEELVKYHRMRYEKQKARLLKDEKVTALIKNKRTRAFFETIAEDTNSFKLKEVLGENLEAEEGLEAKKRKLELNPESIRKTLSFIDSDDEDAGETSVVHNDDSLVDESVNVESLKSNSLFNGGSVGETILELDEDEEEEEYSQPVSIFRSKSLLGSSTSSVISRYRSFKEKVKGDVSVGSTVITADKFKTVSGNSASITYMRNKSSVVKRSV